MRGVSVLRRTLLASTGGRSSPAYSLSICSLFSSASPRSSYSPASSGVDLDAAGSAADLAGDDLLLNDDDDDSLDSAASSASASATATATATAKAATTPTLLQPRVVVYDGVCHLCHRGVKWVIEADKDKKIKFCCLQSKAAEPYMRLCGVDREDVLRRFLFIEGPNLYHQGSTAALRVLSYLPLPYSALSSLLVVPTPLRDVVYDYIAKRRYDWFGKEHDCLVLQEKELLERFIDREEMMDRSWQDL